MIRATFNDKRTIVLGVVCLTLLFLLAVNQRYEECILVSLLIPSFLAIIYGLRRIESLYWLSVFLAPISFSVEALGGVALKFPIEIMIIIIPFIVIIKWIFGDSSQNAIDFRHPINILLVLQLTWLLVVSLSSEMPEVSLKRWLMSLVFVIGYCGLFQKLIKRNPQRLFQLYGWGLLVPMMLIFIKHSEYDFNQATSFIMARPFYDEHTVYGACLAFIIPYFAIFSIDKQKINFANLLMLVVLLFALITSYSRASWLSLLMAFAIMVMLKIGLKFWHFVIGLSIGAMIVGFNFSNYYEELRSNEVKYGNNVTQHFSSITNLQNDASNLERINRWVCAIRMANDKPLQGFGPGTYQFIYDRYQTKEYMTRISTHKGDMGNAHSEYLNSLAEQGIPGMLMYVSLVFCSLFYGMNSYHKLKDRTSKKIVLAAVLGLITFFIHGLFNTFSDISEMAILIYGSLGIILFYSSDKSDSNLIID